ncbi:MAG: ATP-binding cassette domain-containing protein [Lachnoclostridium sp.]|jgi:ATP-binding cassette subfamily B protein RaxB|nr:ATP-binding cassette domain-containing protein [Lachnoclostridium sp.]
MALYRSIIKGMNPFMKKNKRWMMGIFFSNLLGLAAVIVNPKLFEVLIDRVLYRRENHIIPYIIFGMCFVYLVRLLADSISLHSCNRLTLNLTKLLRNKMISGIYRKKYADFSEESIGDWKTKMIEDLEIVSGFPKEQIIDVAVSLISCIVYVILLLMIHPILAGISFIMLPLLILLDIKIGKKRGKLQEEIRQTDGQYYTYEFQVFQNWKELRVLGAEEEMRSRYKRFWDIKAKLGMKQIAYWCMNEIINEFRINYLCKVCLYITAIPFLYNYQITIGMMVVFSLYCTNLFDGMNFLISRRVGLEVNKPQYTRVMNLIEEEIQEIPMTKKIAVHNVALENRTDENIYKDAGEEICLHDISCNKISFQYGRDRPYILFGFSYRFPGFPEKPKWYRIKGKSGCGKSTLIKNLIGVYEPQDGEVYFGTRMMNPINRRLIYQKIGVVMQESFLFHESIRDNICMGNDFDEQWFKEVVRLAELSEVIDRTDGIEYRVGENGAKLSGGERQRVVLARELYKKPEILILDEATSGLNSSLENRIYQNLKNTAIGIVIAVTHRDSFEAMADQVIQMD